MPLVIPSVFDGPQLRLNLQDEWSRKIATIREYAKEALAHIAPEKLASDVLDLNGSCWTVPTTMSINISTTEIVGDGENVNGAFSVTGNVTPDGFELIVKNAHGKCPLSLAWSSGYHLRASNTEATSEGYFDVIRGTMNDIVLLGEDGRLLADDLKLCDADTDVKYCLQPVLEASRMRSKARSEHIVIQVDPHCVRNLSSAIFDRGLAYKAGAGILKGATASGRSFVEIEFRPGVFSKSECPWKLYGVANIIKLESSGLRDAWKSADEFADFMASVTELELALRMIPDCEFSKLSRYEGTLVMKHLVMLGSGSGPS